MWYWKPGSKWHLGRCDGTYTSVCGKDMLGAPQGAARMARVQACGHCWKVWAKGFDKPVTPKKQFANTHI